jgi:hypothetical protein
MWLETQNVTVEGKRCIQIGYGDADMSNAGAVGHEVSSEHLIHLLRRITS